METSLIYLLLPLTFMFFAHWQLTKYELKRSNDYIDILHKNMGKTKRQKMSEKEDPNGTM